MAWTLDCMDQQFFNLTRNDSMVELVSKPAADDPRMAEFATKSFDPPVDAKDPANQAKIQAKIQAADVKTWSGRATSAFLIGWAIGGFGFGVIGDRFGRVRSLSLTILIYSLFTGFSAISTSVYDFMLYRFLTGIGVGGVFAVAVALIAESMPDRARPFTLGLLQMLSAFGNCAAALIFMYLGHLELETEGVYKDLYISWGFGPVSPWRSNLFDRHRPGAALPSLCRLRLLHEPEKWLQAKASGRKTGSFKELLGHPRWRRNALFGLLLALAGVIGLWCIGFFTPDLQSTVLKGAFTAEANANKALDPAAKAEYVSGQLTQWKGISFLLLNVSAFFGMFANSAG